MVSPSTRAKKDLDTLCCARAIHDRTTLYCADKMVNIICSILCNHVPMLQNMSLIINIISSHYSTIFCVDIV
jgi:hypothetical protein